MRFLCDEMLGRLARYLRAAGYDTTQAAGGAADGALLAQARREGRRFVTCDSRIVLHRSAGGVAIVLPRGTLDELARALSAAAGVDWLHRPFTRCLVDNALLTAATATDRVRIPGDVAIGAARACPSCGRAYWAGSHHRRMLARLRAWQQAAAQARRDGPA
jgi:uncharacterized protein with PIN domain